MSAHASALRFGTVAVVVGALALAAARTPGAATDPAGGVRLDSPVSLPSPAPEGSTGPGLAVDPSGRVHLSWLEPRAAGGHAFRWAAWEGRKWTEPRVVAEGDSLVVDWTNLPVLLPLADRRMAAAWPWKAAAGGPVLRVSLSSDGGATWAPPVDLAAGGAAAQQGQAALAPEGAGVRVVWAAGSAAPAPQAGATRGGSAAGHASFGLHTTVLGFDGSRTATQIVDASVCDQCLPAAARAASGVLVAYRDLDSAGVRDIRLAPLSGQTEIRPLTPAADGWKVPGCPVNGPALDAAGSRLALAWYTVSGGKAQVRLGFSADAGKTFGAVERIDDGGPRGRVSVSLLDDASAVAAWLESRGDSALLVARHVRPGSPPGEPVSLGVLSGRRNSGFPRMVRSADELFFAWPEIGRPARILVAQVRIRK